MNKVVTLFYLIFQKQVAVFSIFLNPTVGSTKTLKLIISSISTYLNPSDLAFLEMTQTTSLKLYCTCKSYGTTVKVQFLILQVWKTRLPEWQSEGLNKFSLPKSDDKTGQSWGLPWWSSGKESAFQCRGWGSILGGGTRFPYAAGQLSPHTTTTEPTCPGA